MQSRTPQFDATIVGPHVSVSGVDVVQDNKTALQPQVHSGSVTADRTADQMRSMEVELSDPTGTLTPVDMNSLLAPFGTRIRLRKGVRIQSVDTHASFYGTQQSWLPSGNSTGVLNGVKVDGTGAIALGP